MATAAQAALTPDLAQAIAAQRWVNMATAAVCAAAAETDALRIGPHRFGDDARIVWDGDLLTVVRDGWRIEAFRRYRPLIYLAAFGADEVFGCLRLAVTSLFEFGSYDGDVMVLTDASHTDWANGLGHCDPLRIRTRVLEAADVLDWTLARYRVVAWPEMRRYRPLLYLDIDVICDGPLETLLARLALSSDIHAPGEGPLLVEQDWYGRSLLEADGVTVPATRAGFTTAVLGMPDIDTARPLFSRVPELAEAHARASGHRMAFDCFDQPFANYAAVKSGGIELTLLPPFLDNRYHWLERQAGRRGLSHFTGGTNGAAAKLQAMTAYVATLRLAPMPSNDLQPR